MVKPGFSEDGLTYTVVFQDKTVCIFSVKSGDVIKKYSLDK